MLRPLELQETMRHIKCLPYPKMVELFGEHNAQKAFDMPLSSWICNLDNEGLGILCNYMNEYFESM